MKSWNKQALLGWVALRLLTLGHTPCWATTFPSDCQLLVYIYLCVWRGIGMYGMFMGACRDQNGRSDSPKLELWAVYEVPDVSPAS